MAAQLVNVLIVLLCLLICLCILYGGFYLAKYVVESQHRVRVLEDSYREATDHIQTLERELAGLNSQIEQMQYEAQQNGERLQRKPAWNPRDPLNSSIGRQ